MAAKLQTDERKAAYRWRKWLAEPPNGWIKSVLGFRQFSLRGLHRVQAEWKLVCLALNLRRMVAMRAACGGRLMIEISLEMLNSQLRYPCIKTSPAKTAGRRTSWIFAASNAEC